MADSVYKFIELVGTSKKSWEDAMNNVVATAAKSLRNLRVAEIVEQDVKIEDQKIELYRVKVKISFKFE
ncbi:MAG: dodecin family protein [Promethearchaeota archaeon]